MRRHEKYFVSTLVLLVLTAIGCGGKKYAWTGSAAVIEREPGVEELDAYPPEGQPLRVNPPGFTWTPNEKAKTYRLEVRRSSESSSGILATEPQSSTVYAMSHAFEPGDYVWQVVYLDGAAVTGASKARRFTVSKGLTPLAMPDVARLKEQLAKVRPRLFLSGKRLAEVKTAAAAGNLPRWKAFLEEADASLAEQPYAEPAGYPSAEFNVDEWRRIYTPAKAGSSHLARVALAYRITGDRKYLEGARRWMLAFASWDPRGVSSHKVLQPNGSEGNDEASMPILDRMSLAWDWAGSELTPSEKAKVLAAMTERGNQVLELLKKIDFLTHPFSNHEGRVLAFLGNAGVSFLGDIPDAEKWLDYVLRCYLTAYPGWGGDEGGWAQGLSYWGGYVNYHTGFAEALRGVTDVDLFRRPFYRNTGYLAVYCIPPYAERGAFGDGSDRGPGAGQRGILERLAEAFDDPVLRWTAQSIPSRQQRGGSQRGTPAQFGIENVGSVLRIGPAGGGEPKVEPPVKLDGSRFFTDIGWVAMHSALGDAKDDVWALFKSSRFGSFSHSHADQNSFQLNAYGRGLLIDSGYYPWYGSPHDQLWTRQTRAHNAVLVNGRGQPPFEWAANGTIEDYIREGVVTMARGQAAKAYNIPQRESVKKQWNEWLKEPIPPMEPKVESFERTVAFIASKTRPVFVVHDHLRTDAPATFDWLLHALNQMKLDDKTGVIRVQNEDARLVVRLIATEPFRFSQRDWFPVPPELDEATARTASLVARRERYANQWHLNARTGKPAREIKFVAVMVPYRASEAEPAIAVEKSGDAVVFKVADSVVAAWLGAGAQGALTGGGIEAKGRLAVRFSEGGETQTVVAQ